MSLRLRCQAGQASVELVAAVPFVLLVGLVLWQLVLAGQAAWLCANAARVAARAEAVGGDGASAARSAVPSALRSGVRVETDSSSGRVRARMVARRDAGGGGGRSRPGRDAAAVATAGPL